MTEYRMSALDEGMHSPSDDTNFNESVYVNGFDVAAQCGGWMRLGNRVHEGYAELSVCLYLPDGRVACQFQRPEIATNDDFNAGGLSYEVHEPLREVSMNYRGELMVLDDPEMLRNPKKAFSEAPKLDANIEFRLTSDNDIHGGEPLSDEQPTMYGRDFSLGHFYQHTATEARFEIGGQTFEVNGLGWRDHSWGPRYWTNINFYRLLIANLGPDRGFTVLKITDRDGTTRRTGSLLVDGRMEDIIDIDLITQWTKNKDPRSISMNLRTANRSAELHGEVITLAPLRNRRKVGEEFLISRIAEGFTRWRWDDRSGLGITEYIERLDDGVPVGYPQ